MAFDWNTNFGINANDLAVVPLNWIRQTDDLLGSSIPRSDACSARVSPILSLFVPRDLGSIARKLHSLVTGKTLFQSVFSQNLPKIARFNLSELNGEK